MPEIDMWVNLILEEHLSQIIYYVLYADKNNPNSIWKPHLNFALSEIYLCKIVFLFFRKALKEFTPLKTDATESEQFNSILNEIEVLKKLSSKSEYVINYLDSFSTDLSRNFKVYHIVTNLYEVNYSNFIS